MQRLIQNVIRSLLFVAATARKWLKSSKAPFENVAISTMKEHAHLLLQSNIKQLFSLICLNKSSNWCQAEI